MPEAPEAFHRTLSQLPKEMVTRAELVRRLGWNRESVDRLFRLDHGSRLEQVEAALVALHRRIDLKVRAPV